MRIHLLKHLPGERKGNVELWAEKKGHTHNSTTLFKGEELPAIKDFDCLIILGGFQAVWEIEKNPWLIEEKEFIKTALSQNKPCFGICFGAQLLAESLGGRVYPKEQKERGWHEITLNEKGIKSYLFKDIPHKFLSFHWHGDHFDLPPGCIGLARSEVSPFQAYISKTAPFAGVQFHPEMTLEMADRAASRFGEEWPSGPFVQTGEEVRDLNLKMKETFWLMERLFDNFFKEWLA